MIAPHVLSYPAAQLAVSALTSKEDQRDLWQEALPAYQFLALHQATHDHHLMYLLHPAHPPATQLAVSAFTSKEDQSDLWQEALPAMHAGSISSLSVSAKRASLATASCEDLTVRVWQYSPLRLVLTHYCHHVPTAVALDPWCVVWGFGGLGLGACVGWGLGSCGF